GDRIAMPPAGHYQIDSVLTRLCFAKSFGLAHARQEKQHQPPGNNSGKVSLINLSSSMLKLNNCQTISKTCVYLI
ncbi:hypothetical protein, partial [Klebsiella quasipneumoniae]|uniref:hypothetical protein n=1 Tax=Klebsiella quasipneumoniae TaxID=1463165 RepID=UPI003C78B845